MYFIDTIYVITTIFFVLEIVSKRASFEFKKFDLASNKNEYKT